MSVCVRRGRGGSTAVRVGVLGSDVRWCPVPGDHSRGEGHRPLPPLPPHHGDVRREPEDRHRPHAYGCALHDPGCPDAAGLDPADHGEHHVHHGHDPYNGRHPHQDLLLRSQAPSPVRVLLHRCVPRAVRLRLDRPRRRGLRCAQPLRQFCPHGIPRVQVDAGDWQLPLSPLRPERRVSRGSRHPADVEVTPQPAHGSACSRRPIAPLTVIRTLRFPAAAAAAAAPGQRNGVLFVSQQCRLTGGFTALRLIARRRARCPLRSHCRVHACLICRTKVKCEQETRWL